MSHILDPVQHDISKLLIINMIFIIHCAHKQYYFYMLSLWDLLHRHILSGYSFWFGAAML
jgi:hypothetical protein